MYFFEKRYFSIFPCSVGFFEGPSLLVVWQRRHGVVSFFSPFLPGGDSLFQRPNTEQGRKQQHHGFFLLLPLPSSQAISIFQQRPTRLLFFTRWRRRPFTSHFLRMSIRLRKFELTGGQVEMGEGEEKSIRKEGERRGGKEKETEKGEYKVEKHTDMCV